MYPTTSLDKNCREFEIQTDRNYYVDFETEICQGLWLRSFYYLKYLKAAQRRNKIG